MSRRDWRIFLTSLAIANIYWTLAAYMGISAVEWLWRVVVEAKINLVCQNFRLVSKLLEEPTI